MYVCNIGVEETECVKNTSILKSCTEMLGFGDSTLWYQAYSSSHQSSGTSDKDTPLLFFYHYFFIAVMCSLCESLQMV